MTSNTWLPPKLEQAAFSSPNDFMQSAYACFKRDFLNPSNYAIYKGLPVKAANLPNEGGFHKSFIHIVSCDDRAIGGRLYDFERCERIPWIRPIIDNSSDSEVLKWRNKRKGGFRQLLWLPSHEFLIVLAVRREAMLLWTAYPVTNNHTKEKLKKEYESSTK